MHDSSSENLPSRELLSSIGEALRTYFDARRQRAQYALELQKEQDHLSQKYARLDAPLALLESEMAAELRELLVPNKALLLGGKLRSFKATYGIVSFKQKAETKKVSNADGLRMQAKKDGKLTTVGYFTRTWKPKKIKDILAWLKENPKLAPKYEQFLETTGGYDELYVKPDTAFFTKYDPNRLTESAVNLGRADDAEDETSPDA
jgi:hypothetical protein